MEIIRLTGVVAIWVALVAGQSLPAQVERDDREWRMTLRNLEIVRGAQFKDGRLDRSTGRLVMTWEVFPPAGLRPLRHQTVELQRLTTDVGEAQLRLTPMARPSRMGLGSESGFGSATAGARVSALIDGFLPEGSTIIREFVGHVDIDLALGEAAVLRIGPAGEFLDRPYQVESHEGLIMTVLGLDPLQIQLPREWLELTRDLRFLDGAGKRIGSPVSSGWSRRGQDMVGTYRGFALPADGVIQLSLLPPATRVRLPIVFRDLPVAGRPDGGEVSWMVAPLPVPAAAEMPVERAAPPVLERQVDDF